MPHTKLFKILLLTLFVMIIISLMSTEIFFDTLPTILQDYLIQVEDEYYSSDFDMVDVIYILLGIIFIVVIIGLWRLKNWARHTYLIITIALFPFYIQFGPIVMNPIEAIFSDLSLMIEGALIYMMYMTPLSDLFKVKVNKFEQNNTNVS